MINLITKLISSKNISSKDDNGTQPVKLDELPSLQNKENDMTGIVIVASTGDLAAKLDQTQGNGKRADSPTASVISSISDALTDSVSTGLNVKNWDGQKYSDLVQEGLKSLGEDNKSIIMLYESPSSSNTETSFFNHQVFNYHDFPKGL